MLQTPRLLLIAPSTMMRTPAFDRAAALARAMQLPLHIVAFNYLQALAIAGLFAPEQINQAREGYLDTHRHWLTEQASLMSKHGIEVTSEVVWVHHPYEEILHFINEMSLALIIKDAEDVPALKRVFFTPLDWQLLRDCPVPVHLVTDSRHPLPRKVLAIVDVLRSEEQDNVLNDQIVEAAAKLAAQCNAQLDLLHVYDWASVYAKGIGPGVAPLAAGLYEALNETQHEAFNALAQRQGICVEQRHFIEGVPLLNICNFAQDHQIDIVVMGTVQHAGLNKLLGTTAESLLHHAPCSVWAVKPPRE